MWAGGEMMLRRVAQGCKAALVLYSRSSRSGSQLAAVPAHLSRGPSKSTPDAMARLPAVPLCTEQAKWTFPLGDLAKFTNGLHAKKAADAGAKEASLVWHARDKWSTCTHLPWPNHNHPGGVAP